MGRTALPLHALLAIYGAVLLFSPWSDGADVGSANAARPDEPFDGRMLAGPDDEEPSPEELASLGQESLTYSTLEPVRVSSPLTSPLDQFTETPVPAALPRLGPVPGPEPATAELGEISVGEMPPGQTWSGDGAQDLQVEPAAALLVTSFPGLSSGDNSFPLIPPDPQLAAGPAHLVEMIDVMGKVYDKTGTAVTSTFSLGAFFGVLLGYREADPKVVYDAI